MAQLLNSVEGHKEVLETLIDAFSKDRLASTMLFTGPSGIGKKLSAMALAQALICEKPANAHACGECGACLRVEKNQSESLRVIEPDGAAIKIEQARDVLQFLNLQKLGRSRVVIIDQAHLMNPVAANSLLKSLEEPPAGTYFILISPMAASVLPTIRSRSQTVRFRPLSTSELKNILGPDADTWVLEASQGSVEMAERLIEGKEEFQELEKAFVSYLTAAINSFPGVEVGQLKDLMKERAAQNYVASLLQGVMRDGMRIQADLNPVSSQRVGSDLAKWAASLKPAQLESLADQALAIENEMARNIDRGLLLENFAIGWRKALNV